MPIQQFPRSQRRAGLDIRARVAALEDDEDEVRNMVEAVLNEVKTALNEVKAGQKKTIAWTYSLLGSVIAAMAVQLLLLKK